MIDRLPVTLALSALLVSATEFPVGRGRKPDADPPFYLLYSLPAVYSGAPLADEHEDVSFVYQITAVSGPDPDHPQSYGVSDQAELLIDRARKAVLGRHPATGLWLHALTVPGIKVTGRGHDIEPGGTSEPSDAIMNSVLRIRLDLTSA